VFTKNPLPNGSSKAAGVAYTEAEQTDFWNARVFLKFYSIVHCSRHCSC